MTPPRQGPRPLPLHMAMEGWIVQAAMAGLTPDLKPDNLKPDSTPLSSGWGPSSPGSHVWPTQSPLNPVRQIAALAAGKNPDDITGPWSAYLNPAQFLDAVVGAGQQRLEDFVRGVRAYQSHPFARTLTPPPAVWRRGVAALHDYGGDDKNPPALFVPSLINRGYILDLAADRSLMRAAAGEVRAFLLDWGSPGPAEQAFTTTDYVEGVLIPALEEVKARTGQTPRLVGYCMGGTLAVAPAVLRPDLVSGLALLAAPWDFSADAESSRLMMGFARPMIDVMLSTEGTASVDLLQALFAALDPTLVGRKFRRFATLDPASEEAQRFVALEDWLNDGIPLAGPVARECLFGWYGEGQTMRGDWKIGGQAIDPRKVACPTLAFIPAHDRIVPPASAQALVDAIPRAAQRMIDLGHIGMVAASGAPAQVYSPLSGWLKSPESSV
jgi:polyhydroxyalkanoate synthase